MRVHISFVIAGLLASACGHADGPDTMKPPDPAAPPPSPPGMSPPPSLPAAPAAPMLAPRASTQRCLPDGQFPQRLSETGCLSDMRAGQPGEDLIAFDVASPLWTDGAHKRRWMVVPPGQRVAIKSNGALDFPRGSVLVKEFALQTDAADPASERIVEHRLMVRTETGWSFASYEWRPDGQDADLVTATHLAPFVVTNADRSQTPVNYLYPGERDCQTCHSPTVEQVFGPTLLQLSKPFDYGGRVRNQIEALAEIGVFETTTVAPPAVGMVDPRDGSHSLETRARSWLHANCSHCHQPGGWTPPGMTMDLRFDTALDKAAICNTRTEYLIRIPRIKPGDAEASAIWRRISSKGFDRMPPVGVSVRDPDADIVRQWIESLPGCPPASP